MPFIPVFILKRIGEEEVEKGTELALECVRCQALLQALGQASGIPPTPPPSWPVEKGDGHQLFFPI